MDVDEWLLYPNATAYRIDLAGEKEPFLFGMIVISRYGVFRRSAMNGLFHPYFVNYGRDKIYYFLRLYKEGASFFSS